MKRQIATVLLVLSSVLVKAQPKLQDYEIQPGPFFKVSKRSVPVEFIGYDKTGFYMAYAKGKTGLGELSLSKFGFDLKLINELKLSTQLGYEEILPSKIFMLDKRLYQFSSSTSSSNRKIFLQQIDQQSFSLKEPKLIATIESEGRSAYNAAMNLHFSADSSHLALVYTIPNKKKDNQAFGIIVFDDSLNELWSQRFEIPYVNKLIDLTTHRITNQGEIFILGKRYYDRRRTKVNGEINYDFLLLSLDQSGTIDSFKIESEGKYLKDMQVDIAPSGDIISAGFYSEKSKMMTGGAFYMRIDGLSKETKQKSFKKFEDGFLLQNMTEGKKKRIQKKIDKGKEVELPFFFIDEFILAEDGSTKIIAEQRHIYTVTTYSQYGSVTTTHYDFDDMMLLNIDSYGEFTDAVRVAKNQHTVNDRASFSSYSSAYNRKNIYLIFNDNAENVDYNGVGRVAPMQKNSTTMVMIARINDEGKIIRDALFDRGDVQTKVRPSLCVQLGDNEMLLFGHKGLKTQRFFLLKFK
ncbi:MAG: hypothetical protein AAF616_12680 [Bacteroidota bacterium]